MAHEDRLDDESPVREASIVVDQEPKAGIEKQAVVRVKQLHGHLNMFDWNFEALPDAWSTFST